MDILLKCGFLMKIIQKKSPKIVLFGQKCEFFLKNWLFFIACHFSSNEESIEDTSDERYAVFIEMWIF